jgi:hypothetical protein
MAARGLKLFAFEMQGCPKSRLKKPTVWHLSAQRVLTLLLPLIWQSLDAAIVSVIPEADSFVMSKAPTNNFGGAGAIAVSGSAAINGDNVQNGLFDSLIRFSMSNVVFSLDTSLGTHDWLIYRAKLHLTEVAAPISPVFNRGVGAFEIRWLAANEWTEGTGIPIEPTTNGVTWNDVLFLFDPAKDVSLGQFTNSGLDGRLTLNLALKEPFLSDLRSSTCVTLYLTAANPQIGFTAGSRTFFVSTNLPELVIEADVNPHPQIDAIQRLSTNVSLNFATVSNWTYTLQSIDGLPVIAGEWSNRMIIPAAPTNNYVMFVDGVANRDRFYRLSLSR